MTNIRNYQQEAILLEKLCMKALGDRKFIRSKKFVLMDADRIRSTPYSLLIFLAGVLYDEKKSDLCTDIELTLEKYDDLCLCDKRIDDLEESILIDFIEDITRLANKVSR